MGILARLLNYVPRNERHGLDLGSSQRWELSTVTDASRFLRALSSLIPAGCNLYVEGTNDGSVATWLRARPAPSTTRVAIGTIWPRPNTHHMLATQENLDNLAAFLEANGIHYPWSHVHVYREDSMLVSWHDAFDNPIYVAGSVEEPQVAAFCRMTDCEYSQVERAS